MGTPRKPDPAKLVVPMLATDAAILRLGERALSQEFGEIDLRSDDLPFTHTCYYEREMGAGLVRRIVSFATLVDPGALASIKHATNAIEAALARDGRRRVNLDPGYLTGAKLVLATTKNHAHRIYIGQDIYAEVTLVYHAGGFHPWPWTYPDYAEGIYNPILLQIRERYLAQLRELRR